MRRLSKAATVVVTIALAAIATVAVAIRFQLTPVLNGVRKFNRAVTNPRALREAGSESSRTSVVHHVGRRSGRSYRTPVTAERVGAGFVIPLPYGTGADWVRNVLAGGGAGIEAGGRTWMTRNPRIVPIGDVATELPGGQRRTLGVFGVAQCLRLDIVAT